MKIDVLGVQNRFLGDLSKKGECISNIRGVKHNFQNFPFLKVFCNFYQFIFIP